MNIGLFMGVSAQSMQLGSAAAVSAEAAAFGDVFQSTMTANEQPKTQSTPSKQLQPLLEHIADAETLEELAAVLEKLQKIGENEPLIQRFVKDFTFRQLPDVSVQPKVKETADTQAGSAEESADTVFVNAEESAAEDFVRELDQLLKAVQQIMGEVKQQIMYSAGIAELKEADMELLLNESLEETLPQKEGGGFLTAIDELFVKNNPLETERVEPAVVLQQLKELQAALAVQLETAEGQPVQADEQQLERVNNWLDDVQKLAEQFAHNAQTEKLDGKVPEYPAEESGINENHLTDLSSLEKFPSLQQLSALISDNPARLVEVIREIPMRAEEQAENPVEFLEHETLDAANIWTVLEQLQQIPPEQIQAAMQQLPEKLQAEIAVLFKAVELAAPKMDLFRRQEQLIQTIQPILEQFVSKGEDRAVQPEMKQSNQLPGTFQQVFRFAIQPKPETTQPEQQKIETPVAALPQTESRSFASVQLEKTPESRSETLLREFQAVLNRANFGQANGANRIAIKLYPEHLGQLRIELLEVNGVMTARILASTAAARELLDSQMHQLRQAFTQQNLQVERIDLSQTIQETSKNEREQAFSRQNEQQKDQQPEENKEQEEQQLSFEEYMIELEG